MKRCKHKRLFALKHLSAIVCKNCSTRWEHRRTENGTLWVRNKKGKGDE